ncbi:ribonuclease H-like domain protein [Vibrio phage 1.106.O._10N.286.51.F7]|nr:ribonuclease H-like domain protein [Vibrio phage 1.106.O._10N.286.51.F7]
MEHVMLDIETLGTGVNSVILSIGACYFNPDTGDLGESFHVHVDAKSCCDHGLNVDISTVLWWLSQDSSSQSKITDGQSKSIPLTDALNKLSQFISLHKETKVWGNGPTFDNAIIGNAYQSVNIKCPWEFRNERDVRTVVDLGRKVGFNPKYDMPFSGVRHDALDDAIHQAKYVSEIYKKIFSK